MPSAPSRAEAVARLLVEELVRVRCGGVWHMVSVRAGRLELPEHSVDERRRERALGAFGGAIGGCFTADIAWHGGAGRLPKRLKAYRNDLLLQLRHGGVPFVSELLDAGFDPTLRDSEGRTLLHMLGEFGDAGFVPRLLAAGLDVNARDKQGATPLWEAVYPLHRRWPTELIVALVDAGADPYLPVQGSSALGYLQSREPSPETRELIAHLREKADRHRTHG